MSTKNESTNSGATKSVPFLKKDYCSQQQDQVMVPSSLIPLTSRLGMFQGVCCPKEWGVAPKRSHGIYSMWTSKHGQDVGGEIGIHTN